MSMPSILRAICLLAGVFAVGPTAAQVVTSPQPAKSSSTSSGRPAAVSPAVHRQPRAADVAATKDNPQTSSLRETHDDETMNRIIKGICRGC